MRGIPNESDEHKERLKNLDKKSLVAEELTLEDRRIMKTARTGRGKYHTTVVTEAHFKKDK